MRQSRCAGGHRAGAKVVHELIEEVLALAKKRDPLWLDRMLYDKVAARS